MIWSPQKIFPRILVILILIFFISILWLVIKSFNIAKDKIKLKHYQASYIVVDRNNQYIDDIPNAQDLYGFWEIKTPIPNTFLKCLFITEDKNYYNHNGVDYTAILRAFLQNFLKHKIISGASTIAMQVAKLQYPELRKKTIINKLAQMIIATKLIKKYGKKKLLNHYLKIVPLGPRVYGLSYATRCFFDKPIQDLSLSESALLSAIPRNPIKMNIFTIEGRETAEQRAESILLKLKNENIISEDRYNDSIVELKNIPFIFKKQKLNNNFHFITKIKNKNIHPQSYIIQTTLDKRLQIFINKFAKLYINYYRKFDAENVASIILDRKTGDVLSYLGSAEYNDETNKGKINFATIGHSTGSTIKPFLYAMGIDIMHYDGLTVLDDDTISFISKNGIYQPENYDRNFLGPIHYRQALANSRNIPAVTLVQKIGIEKVCNYLKYLSLIPPNKTADYYGLGLAIGHIYVSLEKLIRVYGIIANDGKDFSLQWLKNKEILKKSRKHFFSSYASKIISLYLSDPVARMPSFRRMGVLEYPFPVAIKTGTSQNYKDAWTLAYTEDYIIGVWTGTANNTSMNHLSGSRSSAVFVRNIIKFLYPKKMDGLEDISFAPPYQAKPVLVKGIHKPQSGIKSLYQYPEFINVKYKNYSKNNDLLSIHIVKPEKNSVYRIDPTIPSQFQTIRLQANVSCSNQVEWYVDNKPYKVVSVEENLRWKLIVGEHIFQAKIPYSDIISDKIKITVLE